MSETDPVDRCWFLRLKKEPVIIRRTLAIGDSVAATVVADKLHELGYPVYFQTHDAVKPVLHYHRNLKLASLVTKPHADLDGCYDKDPRRTERHFSEIFIESANQQLGSFGINLGSAANCRPVLNFSEEQRAPYLKRLSTRPKPWVFICPRSQYWPNRTVPDYIWQEAAKGIIGTCFWIGMDPGPPGLTDLRLRHQAELVPWLSCADILVTTDTGPMHIAAALGRPVVALEQASAPELHLSDQRDFVVLRPQGLDCLNCQKNVCPKASHIPPCQKFDPAEIAKAVNKRLRAQTSEDISAVIPIYRPPLERLKRCIEQVQEQVQEIIVTLDAGGAVPAGAPRSEKIKYVQHRLPNLGFGKNVNFGVRHASGKYLLLLNDDVFLRNDAVSKLRDCVKPGVGMVGHLLYFEDNTIQFAGKFRKPGDRGWSHIDYRKYIPTIKEPLQVENVTAASVLVSRAAFHDVAGFNEEFHMYAEDDAFCMQLLQKGWRVIYTPHAVGTHLGSQTTQSLGKGGPWMDHANKMFEKYWGWWLDANSNRVPAALP